ncbi:MAG: hypothetical protein ACREVH_13870 [Gammaproteobacteria bacterium]
MRFAIRVLARFRANQGFLLASAVAYNTLLSLVPMFALILVTSPRLRTFIVPALAAFHNRRFLG